MSDQVGFCSCGVVATARCTACTAPVCYSPDPADYTCGRKVGGRVYCPDHLRTASDQLRRQKDESDLARVVEMAEAARQGAAIASAARFPTEHAVEGAWETTTTFVLGRVQVRLRVEKDVGAFWFLPSGDDGHEGSPRWTLGLTPTGDFLYIDGGQEFNRERSGEKRWVGRLLYKQPFTQLDQRDRDGVIRVNSLWNYLDGRTERFIDRLREGPTGWKAYGRS